MTGTHQVRVGITNRHAIAGVKRVAQETNTKRSDVVASMVGTALAREDCAVREADGTNNDGIGSEAH